MISSVQQAIDPILVDEARSIRRVYKGAKVFYNDGEWECTETF